MAGRKQFLGEVAADPELETLLTKSRGKELTEDELREQRISFAFGNAMSSEQVTKESVRETSMHISLRA